MTTTPMTMTMVTGTDESKRHDVTNITNSNNMQRCYILTQCQIPDQPSLAARTRNHIITFTTTATLLIISIIIIINLVNIVIINSCTS